MTLITDVDLSILTEEVLETVFAGYNFQKTATTQMFERPSTKSDVPPIAVIVDINKSDNYVFRTQPGAWRRVLMNIFGNALKYTPAGYIKVKIQVTPSSDPADEYSELRLIITDSGIGMSEDYVNNRLFHSFVQENPLSQGTGLGLSIVKQIVESLGGEIEVRSEKDRGTKFTVYCPLKRSMMSPAHLATDVDRELATARGRTEGMNVSFVGFDEDGDYFPVKSLKNKNATMLTLKALDNLVTDWFGMRVQKTGTIISEPPDLFVATESGAKWLRTQYSSQPALALTAPVIVVCQGAASAQSTNATAITVPGQIFECISQPCGPYKLAKALTSCLTRHANRVLIKSTETDSTLPNMEQLNLKENLSPVVAATQTKRPETPRELSSSSLLEPHRPPMTTALSAPEIRSVNSSPVKRMRSTQRPLHCLCVDDNPINLRLLRTFTEKLGHTYGLATNGCEAVSSFTSSSTGPSSRFDVVLMDINMPEMDGLEATRQIRAHERDEGLPPVTIIALTGVASAEAQQEAHVSGVNLFLIKPVRLGELDTVLKGVIVAEDKKEETPKVKAEEGKPLANNMLLETAKNDGPHGSGASLCN
jgi:CheY-like chemotaxis protein